MGLPDRAGFASDEDGPDAPSGQRPPSSGGSDLDDDALF
jgi:hypothetical protein